jgi:hypothetical protein
MKFRIPIFCSAIISIIICAFIVMTDADINGFQGLNSFSAIITVFVLAIIPFSFMCIILSVSQNRGKKSGFNTLIFLSLISSIFLIFAGSTATSFYQYAKSFFLITLILSLLFSLGTIVPLQLISSKR